MNWSALQLSLQVTLVATVALFVVGLGLVFFARRSSGRTPEEAALVEGTTATTTATTAATATIPLMRRTSAGCQGRISRESGQFVPLHPELSG